MVQAQTQTEFKIKFWGVRGSIPCPGRETVRYGGNTSCVEMCAGNQRLIFDGGTGLRLLGEALVAESAPIAAHLFFSHSHWDHIQGFPFFTPAFQPQNRFNIYGVTADDEIPIQKRLHDQMLHPNFPVPLQVMRAELNFVALALGETVSLGEVRVTNGPLNHPGGAVGYRVDWQGLGVAYITDTEHYGDRLDDQVLRLAQGADVLIMDATYTDEEYHDPRHSKVSWGHSTWQEAVKVAQAANVKQLILFHHDPSHGDDFLDGVQAAAQAIFPRTAIAQEGKTIILQASGEGNPGLPGSAQALSV
ncbi:MULTISPECIES: MBL fold metallo-hydrolase [Cyanophyceae]|uniref:MBL fold metallo-hydrolase n=1 Tax=Cyanophyceae TaxID=3028117 RepID=UPI00016DCC86|nr:MULTISPECIES: MBL fold metallo-hydrolase [Cyanophyceae]ACB00375.1 Metal-dependent hydrolases of the beta-lactamase superfamily I protein [Picosynechococcus sp. PCC 7002]SMH48908.1 Phosphoribosyl 1,2-cyclic phosphodiesterase [Picosynechococcus sp. OG1]SMQ81433.1 Phosphoribosyl 1,2-cyclic phosphodiesterase [Synechococcus sp. 7002]